MHNDTEYLNEQIALLKRSTRNNYVAGGLLCLLVVAYAIFAAFTITEVTNPEKISTLVLYTTSKNAPKLISSVEKTLIQQAPAVANSLSLTLQEAIPNMRQSAQIALSDMVNTAFDRTALQMGKITQTYLDTHPFELRGEDESVEDYSKRVAELLATDFAENLDAHLVNTLGGDIESVNLNIQTVLTFMNHHLEMLAQTPTHMLSRTQQLEHLLLSYIIKNYLPAYGQEIR